MKLVTIAIITYNSAKFILETLESAKAQSYQNIELIISDDCSTDNTIEICRDWLQKNKDCFVRTEIIKVKKNTGVAANCNRAMNAAKAEWIKFCAGDDLLLPNCMVDNMFFVKKNKNAKIVFSQLYKFTGKFDLNNKTQKFPSKLPLNLMNPKFSAKDQYKRLLISDRISYTPSYFFNKQAVLSVGGYDETIQFVEDYPMWLKLTKAGIRLYFMEKVTVGYRFHDASLNAQENDKLFSKQELRIEPMKRKVVYPYLPWEIAMTRKYHHAVNVLFQKMGANTNKTIHRFFYNLCTVYLNPFQYLYSFKKQALGLKNKNVFYAN